MFLIALTSPFWSLGHALIEVDDARYAEIPREMAETGHWAVPTLDYFEYVEKPPLPYWLTAASYELFGVSETTARLPLAVLACAGLGLTAWLGWWLLSPEAGLLAAAALSSSGLYFFLARYLTPDMPLTVFLLACVAFILRVLERPEDAPWAAPLAWVAAGLAFLSKGLIGVVFPGGWLVLMLLAAPRWRKPALKLFSPLGALLFFAVVAPWFIAMEKHRPGFFHFFFVEQHFQRFLTKKYDRANPWYFFLLVTPAVVLPWTMPATQGAVDAVKRWQSRPQTLALLVWAAMVVAFFSKSQSKLVTYVLPVMPALCLLAADAALRTPENRLKWARRTAQWLGAMFLAAALAGAVAIAAGLTRGLPMQPTDPIATDALAVATVVFLGAALLAYGLGATGRTLAAGGWLMGAGAMALIHLNPDALSVRGLAAQISRDYRPGDQIYAYGIYLHGVPFYCRAPVDKILNWEGELRYAFRDPANAARRGADADVRALPLKDHAVFIFARAVDVRALLTLVDGEKIKENRLFGRWALLEIPAAPAENTRIARHKR